MKNSEIVSRIINNIRAVNKDSHISKRYILKVAQTKSKFLLAQKLGDKSLFGNSDLFRTIKCFKMKREDHIKCGILEFSRCNTLMKSKEKLPETPFSKFGAGIVAVTTIDDGITFEKITPHQFKLNQNRPNSKLFKKHYYYIKDGYLYLPDSEIELVNVVLLPISEEEVEEKSTCKDCEEDLKGNECKSIWDNEFICSDQLIESVIKDTLQEVFMALRIPIDENPNLDSNIKSKTTN